jgi:hypothetical protein
MNEKLRRRPSSYSVATLDSLDPPAAYDVFEQPHGRSGHLRYHVRLLCETGIYGVGYDFRTVNAALQFIKADLKHWAGGKRPRLAQ